jgi:hypothetical protein
MIFRGAEKRSQGLTRVTCGAISIVLGPDTPLVVGDEVPLAEDLSRIVSGLWDKDVRQKTLLVDVPPIGSVIVGSGETKAGTVTEGDDRLDGAFPKGPPSEDETPVEVLKGP